jgi:catechol 2,3-dioxygenase-like lactoylglutathione lyase family enzyme
MRLTTVTIWVRDPTVLRDWYTTHFRMSVQQETSRFVLLGYDEGASIGFHVGEPLETPDRVQLHIEVDDIDAEYERLLAAGLELEGPPEDRPWGVRSTAVLDPAGHSVEITSPLPP